MSNYSSKHGKYKQTINTLTEDDLEK